MKREELINVVGGAVSTFTSASWLNALARGIDALFSLGKALGSTIRTVINSKKCS